MSTFIIILLVIGIGVLGYALISTRILTKQQAGKGEGDSSIPEEVRRHPYLKNPILLAYVFFFLLVLFIIAYYATSSAW